MEESHNILSHEDKTRITKLEMRMENQNEKTFKLEVEIEKIKEELVRVDEKVDKTNVLIKDEIIQIKEQFTDIRVNMLERFSSIENQLSTTVTKMSMITAALLVFVNLVGPFILNMVGDKNTTNQVHSTLK